MREHSFVVDRTLARLLRQHAPALCDAWMERLREDPILTGVTFGPSERAHLVRLFHDVVRVLDGRMPVSPLMVSGLHSPWLSSLCQRFGALLCGEAVILSFLRTEPEKSGAAERVEKAAAVFRSLARLCILRYCGNLGFDCDPCAHQRGTRTVARGRKKTPRRSR